MTLRSRMRNAQARVMAALNPEPRRPACAALWDTPMVTVNGDLTTCCLDERLENRLGNINESPLATLWNGQTLHRWRVAQAEGRFQDSGPHCTRCNWASAGAMDESRLRNYLTESATSPPTLLSRIHAIRHSYRKSR